MRGKYWKVGGVILGVGIAAATSLLNFKERDTYLCQSCWSGRDVYQWRVGVWRGLSVPLSPQWERVTLTRFLTDFVGPSHVHEWKFAQGSPYYFFGTAWGGCALGSGRHRNELVELYERYPEFRSYIHDKIGKGSISKVEVVALMSSPWGEESTRRTVENVRNDFFETVSAR